MIPIFRILVASPCMINPTRSCHPSLSLSLNDVPPLFPTYGNFFRVVYVRLYKYKYLSSLWNANNFLFLIFLNIYLYFLIFPLPLFQIRTREGSECGNTPFDYERGHGLEQNWHPWPREPTRHSLGNEPQKMKLTLC